MGSLLTIGAMANSFGRVFTPTLLGALYTGGQPWHSYAFAAVLAAVAGVAYVMIAFLQRTEEASPTLI